MITEEFMLKEIKIKMCSLITPFLFLTLVTAQAPCPLTLIETLQKNLREGTIIYPHKCEPPPVKNPFALVVVRCPYGEYEDGICRWQCQWGQNAYGGCRTRAEYCEEQCEMSRRFDEWSPKFRWGDRPISAFPITFGFDRDWAPPEKDVETLRHMYGINTTYFF